MSDDLASIARRFCLQNALQHEGTCQPKGLVGRVMGGHPELRGDPGAVVKALMAAGAEVNAMTLDEQRAALEADAPELLEIKKKERITGLKPLPGADQVKKVVLRFAPNPNGPLSLGHGRGVAVMAEYARMYNADVVLRFDDTDPQVKPPLWNNERNWNGYDMCLADWTWLAGAAPTRIVKASDRLEVYYEHARALIQAGGAYVCTCETGAWRDQKNMGLPCEHRSATPDAVAPEFEKMLDGTYGQGEAVLRVKTDIQHKDPALRDWTAFRIVAADAIHPRERAGEIGHFGCWPLLDFESAVEDHLQGVTHIIRGKDLMDSTRKQGFLYQHMGWDYPTTLYWGRVSVHEFGKFSTSWMRREIEAGRFEDWNDPRLPTLLALRRRGYRPDAMRAFWVGLGLTEKDIAISMENLDAEDGKLQDPEAPRYFFVPDPEQRTISGIDGMVARPLLHPPEEARGRRELPADATVWIPGDEAEHERLRLKDLGNVQCTGSTGVFTGEEMDRSLRIVQWLPSTHAVPYTVLWPETLPEDAPEGATPGLRRIEGLVEPAALAHVGKVVQFERFGFVRLESETVGIWLHD